MCSDKDVCPAERTQQSTHSPGIVEDTENLGRIIIAPEHVDTATGELKPGAFRIDDLKTRGLSLVRLEHASEQQIQDRADQLAARREESSFEGLAVGSTKQVRSFRDNEDRQFLCVIDDGEENFPAHAMARRSADQSDGALRRLRGDLIDLLKPIKQLSEIYG